jgi:hypothetical protein
MFICWWYSKELSVGDLIHHQNFQGQKYLTWMHWVWNHLNLQSKQRQKRVSRRNRITNSKHFFQPLNFQLLKDCPAQIAQLCPTELSLLHSHLLLYISARSTFLRWSRFNWKQGIYLRLIMTLDKHWLWPYFFCLMHLTVAALEFPLKAIYLKNITCDLPYFIAKLL